MPSRILIRSLSMIAYDGKRDTTSRELISWCSDRQIGSMSRTTMLFTDKEAERIRGVIAREYGVTASLDGVSRLSRGEAGKIVADEKFGRLSIPETVSIRALSGKPLMIGIGDTILPAGTVLHVNPDSLETCRHETVLMVENLETFMLLDHVMFPLCGEGENPLVIWRGGVTAQGAVRAAARAVSVLAATRPVDSFPDLDPAGLGISARYPALRSIRLPAEDDVRSLFREGEDREGYAEQLDQEKDFLDACRHPDVQRWWRFLKDVRIRFPQERFQLA